MEEGGRRRNAATGARKGTYLFPLEASQGGCVGVGKGKEGKAKDWLAGAGAGAGLVACPLPPLAAFHMGGWSGSWSWVDGWTMDGDGGWMGMGEAEIVTESASVLG